MAKVHKITNVPVSFIWRLNLILMRATSHYNGHWKGWALKIKTFLGPEMAMSEASSIWAPKSRVQ
jgi:hypothetical protein